MIKLVCDSGATKAEWCLINNGKKKTFFTQGISPYFLNIEQINDLLQQELIPKLKNIKVVVSDLDGTLLNTQHRISDYTKSIFQELHNQNYLIVVATGRHHLDAMAIIEKLEVPVYLVSSNGARIHSPEKEELFSFNLDSDVVKAALNVEIDPEITVVLFKENVWQTNKVSEKLNAFQEKLNYRPELVDYKKLEDFGAIKIFFSCDNHEKLVKLKDDILANSSEHLHHAFS